ncbi:MAG: undecaprenyl-phosphate glucose phosphotransferase [bacterium]|nr:undecaprenyl-phosphate glucose phosphotransferase [bacterium]
MPHSDINRLRSSDDKSRAEPSPDASKISPEEMTAGPRGTEYERFKLASNPAMIRMLTIITLVRVLDIIVVVSLGFSVFLTYVNLPTPTQELFYQLAIISTGIITAVVFESFNLYPSNRIPTSPKDLLRLWGGWTLVIVLVVLMAFFTKVSVEYSRVWLLGWYLSAGVMLMMERVILLYLTQNIIKTVNLAQNIIIIGDQKSAEQITSQLLSKERDELRISGVFYDGDAPIEPSSTNELVKRGALKEVFGFAQDNPIDAAIITHALSDHRHIEKILKVLHLFPIDIHVAAHPGSKKVTPTACSFVGDVPVFNLRDKPISGGNLVMKLLFDKIVATAMIVGLAPVMALIALALKLEGGKTILFKQKRIGFNNELIEIFKFRSMYENHADQNATKLVSKNDPRVTRVGRFIRRTSLDELPQLFNVLKGDLSLVGPRPHATHAKANGELYDKVVDDYFARHRVKPGITGWAQINGWRGETDTYEKIRKRVEYDLYYVENWSILFDLQILLQTPLELLHDEQAY